MKFSLQVLKLNGQCSVQDLGRSHAQHLGFSVSGAADENAFLSANRLLDNDLNHAALEITLGKISLQANCNCTIAITGADCAATINNRIMSQWQAHILLEGDVLVLSQPKQGLHSYISVKGGINNTMWLGSRSQTFNEASLGFNGEEIKTGSIIPLTPKCNISKSITDINDQQTNSFQPNKYFYQNNLLTLRFIPQRLWQSFSDINKKVFISHSFTISTKSNRMGYRLSTLPKKIVSPLIQSKTLSKPVTFGTIQLPENGEPIILMKERQTIGGYPVLGTVIQTDLFRLSQLRAGEKIKFIPTTIIQAQQQLSMFYQRFKT